MPRRVAGSLFIAFGATLLLLATISPRGPWLRLLIAPAWMLGSLITGDANRPNPVVLWVSLFFLAFATSYLLWPAFASNSQPAGEGAKRILRPLFLFCGVVAFEALFYHRIAKTLYNLTGGQGDIGSAATAYIPMYIRPAAVGLIVIASTLLLLVARRAPESSNAIIASIWLLDYFLFLGSIALYFRLSGNWG